MLQRRTPCQHRDPSRLHSARVVTAPEGTVHARRTRYASTSIQNACTATARAIASNAERCSTAGAAPGPPRNTRSRRMHGAGAPHGPYCKAKPLASTETPAACIPLAWRPPLKAPCMPGAPGTPPRRHKTPAPRLHAPAPRMRNATPLQAPRPPAHAIRGDAACTAQALSMRPAAKGTPLRAPRPQPPALRPCGDCPGRHRACPARRHASTTTENAGTATARAIATNAERYAIAGAAPARPCTTR